MSILMQCPCGAKLSVDDCLAGKKTRCPRCRAVLLAPAPTTPVPPPLPAKTKPSADEPILGIVLDEPAPASKAPKAKEPRRGAVIDERRPVKRSRSFTPEPAPVWPKVVGGIAATCMLIGAVISVVAVLSNSSGPDRIQKDKKAWVGAKKDPFWDKKAPIWDKKGWPVDEKKADDKKDDFKIIEKEPPFRPVEPIIANLADGRYQFAGQILLGDTFAPRRLGKIFHIQLQGQRTYVIDLVSNQFDAYLYLHDMAGVLLAFDDDGGDGLNSRITYKTQAAGTYKIIATSLGSRSVGNFTLSIRDAGPDPKAIVATHIKLKDGRAEIEGRLTMTDKKRFGKAAQEFLLQTIPGHEYTIELKSTEFDPFLILRDAKGKPLSALHNGEGLARIRPVAAGTCKIFATSKAPALLPAAFTLTVREAKIGKVVQEERIQLKGGMIEIEGHLSSKKELGRAGKQYVLETRAGFEYWMDIKSQDFEPFLIVRDAGGKAVLAGGAKVLARLIFRPPSPGSYKIHATVKPGTKEAEGAFTLTIREKTAVKVEPPLPPGEIAGKPEVEDGLSVRRLTLSRTRPLACWDAQGKYLFAFDQLSGRLSRIRAADFTVEASATHVLQRTGYPALTMSAQGLVLTDSKNIMLIDPQTLALKKAFKPQLGMQVTTSPGASVALGIYQTGSLRNRDVFVDLKGLTEVPLAGLPTGNISAATGKCISADGKSFFLVPAQGKALQRYRIQDARLELEEETKISLRIPTAIAQRADGKYVVPYCISSEGPVTDIGVYESNRLAKPAFTLPGSLKAVCFLQPGGHILGVSDALELFSEAGAKVKSFRWPRAPILSLIPHPTRPAAVAITVQGAYYLELTELKIAGK